MITIAFINNKGGVGKTSSTTTISHMISTLHNKKVLLIDLDPQGNCTSLYSNVNMIKVLSSMLKGESYSETEYSLEDMLLDSTLDIHKCIKHTDYNNLDIIPALLTLSQCEERLKADIKVPQQFRLKMQLAKIQNEYDYCILDCSPSVSIINVNGLAAADYVYIPCKCDAWSAVGICISNNLIDNVATYNSNLKLGGIFFTQWENKNVNKMTYELLKEFLGDKIIPITIRKNKSIEEMTYMQKPLLEYDKKSPVTEDYMELTNYILQNAK